MATFSNAQILAAVVTEWLRPAISQIASGKISSMSFMQNLQTSIIGYGLVGRSYNIATDIRPMAEPFINALMLPIIEGKLSQVPDQAIPQLAYNILEQMESQEKYTILDGLVTFEREDIEELRSLLEKNLPLQESENYRVIK